MSKNQSKQIELNGFLKVEFKGTWMRLEGDQKKLKLHFPSWYAWLNFLRFLRREKKFIFSLFEPLALDLEFYVNEYKVAQAKQQPSIHLLSHLIGGGKMQFYAFIAEKIEKFTFCPTRKSRD